MLNGDTAKYRVNDMVRSADLHRASRQLAKRRSARRATSVRVVVASALAMLTIPVRH